MAQSEWQIRLMPQVAFGAKNTVQRPNTSEGTRVYLNKDFNRNHSASFSPRIELGATLLIRDAYIQLQDDSRRAKYSNVGVAPLLSYYLEWKADDRFSLFSYGDAFAIKAGRAEDIFAGAKYRFTDMLYATAGYRLLEGGSDGDKVYTMAFFHFVSFGLGVVF